MLPQLHSKIMQATYYIKVNCFYNKKYYRLGYQLLCKIIKPFKSYFLTNYSFFEYILMIRIWILYSFIVNIDAIKFIIIFTNNLYPRSRIKCIRAEF